MVTASGRAPAATQSVPAAASVTLEQLYRDHKQFVYQTALRFTGGRRDCAEDVVQAVFLRASRHLATLAGQPEVRGWLYTVTLRLAYNELRNERAWHRRIMDAWLEPKAETTPHLADTLLHAEAATRALQALRALRAEHQVIAIMAFVDETPQHEIAGQLNISEAKVSRILAQARKHVTACGWRDA